MVFSDAIRGHQIKILQGCNNYINVNHPKYVVIYFEYVGKEF